MPDKYLDLLMMKAPDQKEFNFYTCHTCFENNKYIPMVVVETLEDGQVVTCIDCRQEPIRLIDLVTEAEDVGIEYRILRVDRCISPPPGQES